MRTRYLTFLLSVLMSMAASVASAHHFEVDGIYYNITSSSSPYNVEVTYQGDSYNSYSDEYTGSVTIPESVTYNNTTYSVTSIGSSAFRGCSGLTSVTIPNSVTNIGYSAFYDCTGLTSITIPNSVISIDNYVFNGCMGLKNLIFEDGDSRLWLGYNSRGYYSTGKGLFYDCPLETLYLGRNISYDRDRYYDGISDRCENYGYSPFYRKTTLTSITISNSVTSIGDYAFYGCSCLTSIPNSVTSIGRNALSGTAWYDNQPDGLVYVGKIVYKYKGTMSEGTNLVLEEGTLGIAGEAFVYCGLKSITIPNSVTSIGESAFYGSDLTSVIIPNSVTSIDDGTFYACRGLTSVTIPNSMTTIGECAFAHCTRLTSVAIPNSVTTIGYSAFYGCTGLTKAEFASIESLCNIYFEKDAAANPLSYAHHLYIDGTEVTDLVIPNSVTSIGEYAFYNCSGLTSITIPNSVTSIGNQAFGYCSGLTSVTIPNSVSSIGEKAFSGCSGLTKAEFASIESICGISFADDSANPLCSANHLYIDGTEVTDLIIPNSVTTIGRYAFSGCSSLTSITIPNSVTNIRNYAFYGCSGLTSVTIPNSVTNIDPYAFAGCSTLISVIIGTGLSSIATNSFDGCTAITSVSLNCGGYVRQDRTYSPWKTVFGSQVKEYILGEAIDTIGDYGFYQCDSLATIRIPASVKYIGYNAFTGCNKLSKADFGSIESLCGMGFYNGNSNPLYYAGRLYVNDQEITELKIPEGVTSIGAYAFYGCKGLASATISNSVTSIGNYAFSGNKGLASVTIGNGVTSIGEDAFYGCTGLTSVTIPNSVTSIGGHAFSNCTGLKSITIPNSVTSIGGSAFYGCNKIINLSIGSGLSSIGNTAFAYCDSLTYIVVSAENEKYDSRDNCNAIIEKETNRLVCGCNNTVIPESVTTIGRDAFYGCTIDTLVIPQNVSALEAYAFRSCGIMDVFCYANAVPTGTSNSFSTTTYRVAALHVPGSLIAEYTGTSPWNRFYTIWGMSDSVVLVDEEEYANSYNLELKDTLTYQRTFADTNWQPLYVPFAMVYEDWADNFEVARINNVHQWDIDDDGKIDRTALEIIKIKEGSIEPNTPYLIKAKEIGEKCIAMPKAHLMGAMLNSIDCSSVETRFTFTGTYTTQGASMLSGNGYYSLANGALRQVENADEDLGSYRWYMSATDRSGNSVALGEVKVMIFGEEDIDCVEELTMDNGKLTMENVYDLQGRRQTKIQKGINIIRMSDGTAKKMMVK